MMPPLVYFETSIGREVLFFMVWFALFVGLANDCSRFRRTRRRSQRQAPRRAQKLTYGFRRKIGSLISTRPGTSLVVRVEQGMNLEMNTDYALEPLMSGM